MEIINLIKWLGTIICLMGIGLTSFNFYPSNIYFGLIGSALWAFAGMALKDYPLFLVEFVSVCMYATGIWVMIK